MAAKTRSCSTRSSTSTSNSAIVPAVGYELVGYEVADGVATVTLNNPEKRNMLSGQMLAELVDAMRTARDSDECGRSS